MNVTVHPVEFEGGKVLAYASVTLIFLHWYICFGQAVAGLPIFAPIP